MANPTGFTVQFSGPLSLDSLYPSSNLAEGDQPFQAAPGRRSDRQGLDDHPERYVEAKDQLSFVFDQPLPPGHYSLIVPTTHGATDLAGQAPTAPGEPAGVLTTWDITANTTTTDPTDLGPLLKNVQIGINRSDALAREPRSPIASWSRGRGCTA